MVLGRWTHFVIETLLDCCVAQEYEDAWLMVEVLDRRSVFVFELSGLLDSGVVYLGAQLRDVFCSLLEGDCTLRN